MNANRPDPRVADGPASARARHRGRTRYLALAVVVTGSLAAPAAHGWVRTRTALTQAAFYRDASRVTLVVATPPESFSIAPADVHAAAQAAVDAWSYPAVSCTSLALTVAAGFKDNQAVARDGLSMIIMRKDLWCRDPVAMTECHDPTQVAVTTVFSVNHPGALDDGLMLEADIEVNDVDYQWAVIPDGPISPHDYGNAYDLTSALTHEAGHFIGLAHTCQMSGDPIRYDNRGGVSPDCTMLSADNAVAIYQATMYPQMNPVDVMLRTLTDDDVDAVCSLYPVTPTVTGGCDVSSTPGRGDRAVMTVVFAALALAVARRRPRL